MSQVLIAEDDPDTAKLIADVLEERLGVKTDHLANGALVPDRISATQPDLLILDVWLPGMNGLDVFDVVRGSGRWGDVPVLFVTASGERAREALEHKGVRDVLTKPFDLDVLVGRVDALLSERAAA